MHILPKSNHLIINNITNGLYYDVMVNFVAFYQPKIYYLLKIDTLLKPRRFMRRFISKLFFFAIVIHLFSTCDFSYTISGLFICNKSGQPVFIESYIVSRLSSDTLRFILENGEEYTRELAISSKHKGESESYLPLSHCVHNQDAQVSLYSVSENGEKHLIRTWYYADREKDGRELFKEDCLSQEMHTSHDGGCFPYFVFTVLPEDLVVNE